MMRRMTFLVRTTNAVDAIDRALVADVAAEGIARVGRIGDQTAIFDNLDDCCHAPWLRVVGMNFNELGHARIVGTCRQDARSENPVSCRSFAG